MFEKRRQSAQTWQRKTKAGGQGHWRFSAAAIDDDVTK
jgi:hypothetical protein